MKMNLAYLFRISIHNNGFLLVLFNIFKFGVIYNSRKMLLITVGVWKFNIATSLNYHDVELSVDKNNYGLS